MKKDLIFGALFLILSSCVDTIPLDSIPVNKMLVVNSLITPDSLFSCTISRIYSINDTSNHFIDDALVTIFDDETGKEICTLPHLSNGYYQASSMKPIAGSSYRIEINANGYQRINGKTKIPQKQEASSVLVKEYGGYDPIVNDNYSELFFTIADTNDGINYYEIWLASMNKWGTDYEIVPGQPMKKVTLKDSIYIVEDAKSYSDFTIVDAVLQAEGLMRYKPSTLVFSDNLFNGSTHNFSVRCDFQSGKVSFFILYSLSAELYKFRTSFMQHKYEMGAKGISRFDDLAGLDFSSKAIDVYSNVHGGYGIFAGYNCHILFSGYDSIQYLFDEHGNIIGTKLPEIIKIDQAKNPYEMSMISD